MLYDPKWKENFTPAVVGTRAHILEWLKGQPAGKKFDWLNGMRCVCGQYSEEFLESPRSWEKLPTRSPIGELNAGAFGHKTFGQVYQAMRKRWA